MSDRVWKAIGVILCAITVIVIGAVIYGIDHQCPNVAVQMFCGVYHD